MKRLELPTTVLLPIELTNGNDGRSKHFGRSAKRRKEYAELLAEMGLLRRPTNKRVRVTITRVLGKRQSKWDPDSIGRGNAKELMDALTACGWWHDDSARWIERVDYRQDDTRRQDGPAVELTIEEAP